MLNLFAVDLALKYLASIVSIFVGLITMIVPFNCFLEWESFLMVDW